MDTGQIVWVNRFIPDVWLMGCDNAAENPNCPTDQGPDLDFSASPILTTTAVSVQPPFVTAGALNLLCAAARVDPLVSLRHI